MRKNQVVLNDVVQHFVDTRTKPFKTMAGFMYEGSIFYSDIYSYLKNVSKLKGIALRVSYSYVCDKLVEKHFLIHS